MTVADPDRDPEAARDEAAALARLRRRIDAIDDRLVGLLHERGACVLEIGRIKQAEGLEVYQPAREQEILERVRQMACGPLSGDALTRIFRAVIEDMRRLARDAARG